MENAYNQYMLSGSEIIQGNYHKEIFTNFTDLSKMKKKNFRGFSDKLKLNLVKNSQLRLYLSSTTLQSEDSVKANSSTETTKKTAPSSSSQQSSNESVHGGSVMALSMHQKKSSNINHHNTFHQHHEIDTLTSSGESKVGKC